jgi:dTDP-4-dehydrorhamnose 3,5-epimerase
MQIVNSLLSEILLIKPNIIKSDNIFEITFSSDELKKLGIDYKFIQENEIFSNKNVLRGLHYQIIHPQGKLIQVIEGEIFDFVVDMRKSSPTFGLSTSFILSSENNLLAWIPPGFAHGFYVLGNKALINYKVTDYRYPEYERTLLWSDPILGIVWPFENQMPILSEKDADGKLLKFCELYP